MADETRRHVYNRQGGSCLICGRPLDGDFILHHIKNRSDGGATTASNLEARHKHCEVYAHRNFNHGNPNGQY